MANLGIHEIIANQCIKKGNIKVSNKEEFIKGTIAPDLNQELTGVSKDKDASHYGKWSNGEVETNIDKFINDPKVDVKKDYWKGYLLHLLTDYYFYHVYFKEEFERMKKERKGDFNTDFSCMGKKLVEKYDYVLTIYTSRIVKFKNGEPVYLKFDKVIDFINRMSDLNIDKEIKKIKEKGMEGLEIQ